MPGAVARLVAMILPAMRVHTVLSPRVPGQMTRSGISASRIRLRDTNQTGVSRQEACHQAVGESDRLATLKLAPEDYLQLVHISRANDNKRQSDGSG